jgi:hypothetical protein
MWQANPHCVAHKKQVTAFRRCRDSPMITTILPPFSLMAMTGQSSGSFQVSAQELSTILRHDYRPVILRVVSLRWMGGLCGGAKRIGRRIIVERAPAPSAAVREPLAILHREINVMLSTRHRWLTGIRLLFFRYPMDFRHFGAVWEWLAVVRNALLVSVDHCAYPLNSENASPPGTSTV